MNRTKRPASMLGLAAGMLGMSLCLPVAAADAPASSAKCRVPSLELPVRMINDRPIVDLNLDGATVALLLDSGAQYSMLGEASARQLGLTLRDPPGHLSARGVAGEIKALKATTVKRVELQGEVIRDVDFLVGGNAMEHGISGLLGRNLLSVADTEYDLAHGVVRLMFPTKECRDLSMAYWAGDAPVIEAPLISRGDRDHTMRVTVMVNGRKVEALMDTGASRSVLTIGTARRAGIAEADMTPDGRAGGAGANFARVWQANVERFEFGGEKVSNNRFPVVEISSDDQGMLLGVDYFLSHRVYVSRLQGKVYATWNGGAVFSKTLAAVDQYDQRYAAKAEAIADDDADGLARRGSALLARGEPARALVDLDRAIQLKPTAGHFEARSRVQVALKRPREALADLDEALRLDPALAHARMQRVPLRAAAGDKAGAASDLTELDATLPRSAHLRWQLGELLARGDAVPPAVRQYDLWIDTHPNDLRLGAAHAQRCWVRTRMNAELDKALEDCRKATEMDKGDALARSHLGWTYLRAGDLPQSLKAFDASIRIESKPWSLYGRGLARLRAGDVARGQADIEAARREKPGIDAQVRLRGLDVAPDAPPAAPGGDVFAETEDL